MAKNNSITSRFYNEMKSMSSNIRSSKLPRQCKNGRANKITMATEILLSLNLKKEHVWNLRQGKSSSDERKERKRRILANIMLIFFLSVADEKDLFRNVMSGT